MGQGTDLRKPGAISSGRNLRNFRRDSGSRPDGRNRENLREELGDVLLQVIFHSTIAAEKGDFTIEEVVKGVTEKMILRHPHVFGEEELKTADDVLNNWDKLKANEREKSGKIEKEKDSILDEVPIAFSRAS